MVDKSLVRRKLSALDEYLEQVGEYSDVTLETYANDWKVQRIVERTLHMMIETCLDISGHIIAEEKFEVPATYADMFRILLKNGILRESRKGALEKMARFRNVVVHNYERIDPQIVIGILRNNLGDFEEFKTSILRYLKD